MKASHAHLRISRNSLRKMIDALEPRRFLAANIVGTAGDDTFIISVNTDNSINLLFNGAPETVNAPGDGFATVDAFEGNDTIVLLNTGNIFWDLLGRSGNDSYTVGQGNLGQDIRRDVDILDSGATAGNNRIVINDSGANGSSYRLNGLIFESLNGFQSEIQMGNGAPGDEITIQGSAGDDTLTIDQLRPNTIIDMGNGHDTVRLGGTNNIVSTTLPDNATLVGGGGQDTLSVDDSNPASPRTSIKFDDSGLLGGPDVDDFNNLHINTHPLSGGLPEAVTFRGNACITPFVSIVGGAGPDLVQAGEPGNGIFGRLYLEHMILDLGTGDNRLEINETPGGSANNWRINNNELTNDSGGSTSFSTTGLNLLQAFLNGTENDDTYTVVDTPDTWSFEIDGKLGNDRLQMGGVLDLDDAFDNGVFTFIGGAGVDTMDLSDIADQLGDADDYQIGEFIAKGDFGTSLSGEIRHSFVDNLVLHLDNDPNRLFFDLGAFTTVEIFGNNGSDTFFNDDETIIAGKQFIHTFADSMTFHGGSGADILSLSDVDGPAGSYALESDFLSFSSGGSPTSFLDFDSMSTIDLFCSNQSDTVQLREKPAGVLNFGVGAGNDTVIVGGGDLDSSGWMSGGITLSGDNGTDEIVFDDALDTQADGETSHYTMASLVLSKGTPQIVYAAFEKQSLFAANGLAPGQINLSPAVTINGVSGQINSTTITGGTARGCIVNVTQGNVDALNGSLALNDISSVNLNNQNSTVFPSSYRIGAGGLVRTSTGRTIPFSNVGRVMLNCSAVADSVVVESTGPGMNVIVNGNDGNDNLTLGNGDIETSIKAQVTLNGGAGTDALGYSNTFDITAATQVLDGTNLNTGGFTHTASGFESLQITEGPGGTNLTVNSTTVPTTVLGGSGNDVFTVGGGNIAANFLPQLSGAPFFDGGGGTDAIILNDINGLGVGGSYEFERPTGTDRLKRGAGNVWYVNWANMESATLEASDLPTTGTGTADIFAFQSLTPLRINGNGGGDRVFIMDTAHPVFVNTGTGDHDQIDVNLSGGAPVTAIVDQNDEVNGIMVRPGGTLRVAAGATLAKSQISGVTNYFDLTGGVLDLAGGSLLSRAGGPAPAQFRAQILTGRNGGAWNGTGGGGAINSSLAAGSTSSDGVGYGLGSEIAPTTIGGFTIAPGDTLLRYALDGDADLNGVTNISDFARLAANFNGTNKIWTTGDSNYDNTANISDFASLAANFNQSSAARPAPPRSIATPFSARLIDELL